jgi:hypothetical protein
MDNTTQQNTSIGIVLECLSWKIMDLTYMERDAINRGCFHSAAIYTGKIVALKEVADMLQEIYYRREEEV